MWVRRTSGAAWSKRFQHGTVSFQGKLWVLGGVKTTAPLEYFNDVWSSSDSGATWDLVTASAGWSPRAPHVAVHSNQLWVLGSNFTGFDVWKSSDGASWTEVATPDLLRREDYALTAFGGYLWVMGGWNYNTPFGLSRDIYRSIDGVTWDQVFPSGTYWTPRQLFGLQGWSGDLWVFGGVDDSGRRNDVWHSSSGMSWTNVGGPIPWSQRIIEASAVSGNSLVLFGGDGNTDLWHTVNGLQWFESPEEELDQPGVRYFPGMIGGTGQLWILGGQESTATLLNDVWSYSSVGISPRFRWRVKPTVGRSCRVRWKVAVDPLGKTTKERWAISTVIGTSPRFRWVLGGTVGRSSKLRWNLKPVVGATGKDRWSLLNAAVGKTSKERWAVRTSVGLSSRFRWKVGPICAAPQTFLVWGLSGSEARSDTAQFADCVA